MNSVLILMFLISLFSTKPMICVSNDENVWQTFGTNEELEETVPKFGQTSEQMFETGRDRYQLMTKQESIYGKCWTDAIQSLHTNCKQLNDEIQSRLALSFANCFLRQSGMKGHSCPQNQKIADCFKDINDRTFNAYTEFYTHTQSVCFYLQSELWQQKSESTIERLTQTSFKVKNRLEDASKQLDQLNGLQELSIGSQRQLNEELIAARDTINEFKASSAEQRFIVKEILDRFIRLQDFVLIEMSYGYSLLFFFISMLIIYFITTPVRTNEARLWLFIILLLNLCAERLIASNSVDDPIIGLKSTSNLINQRIWISRKVTLCLMATVLLWFAITYKNYGRVNYNILNEHTLRLNNIENQLSQLLRTGINALGGGLGPLRCNEQFQIDYSSESDNDSTDDSDYNTDGTDVTQSSADTCSTIEIISSTQTEAIGSESKRSFTPIETISRQTYGLRPRRAITYTKSGVNESIDDFVKQIKDSEIHSTNNRINQHFKNFMSNKD